MLCAEQWRFDDDGGHDPDAREDQPGCELRQLTLDVLSASERVSTICTMKCPVLIFPPYGFVRKDR